MEKKKFAIVSIASNNLTNTIVHDAEMIRGFKHSPNHNPTLILIYDGVIKPSIFMKALMGDDNG